MTPEETLSPGTADLEAPEEVAGEVLIADDNPDNVELLVQAMEMGGFRTRTAATGRETLDQIAVSRPDVVLLDLMMPGLDGFEVLRQIRSDPALAGIKVVVVSAKSQAQDVIEGLDLGADDYVSKPFHPEVVLARVKLQYHLKSSWEELGRTTQLKDEVLGIVSHDLQNPVSAIMGYCNLLMEDTAESLPLKALARVQRILKNARFMTELIADLLDMVKIEAGRMRVYSRPTDVRPVLESAVERNAFMASEKEIALESVIDPGTPKLQGDGTKVQQVLNNLISNGIKFSRPGARVSVRAGPHPDGVLFQVEDTGQGIPEEEQGRLFKRFARLSVQSTKGERSTGLGLMIARKIVDLHGGRIWVDSQVGKGSTFSFVIPSAKAPAGMEPGSRTTEAASARG